jgi:transcription-repair coupling factor (superfamily II helicase)
MRADGRTADQRGGRTRAAHRARHLTPPEGMWDQFLARFPYQETDDQLQAIADVLDATWSQRQSRWTG